METGRKQGVRGAEGAQTSVNKGDSVQGPHAPTGGISVCLPGRGFYTGSRNSLKPEEPRGLGNTRPCLYFAAFFPEKSLVLNGKIFVLLFS